MGKKKRIRNCTRAPEQPEEARPGGWQQNNWIIVAGIFFFLSAGLLAKVVLAPAGGRPGPGAGQVRPAASADAVLENNVRLVSANFRCACGQCGELPLIDCTCESPRGAKETKDFIRERLREGLTVDQVIQRLEERYGHRIT
jgi:cytochrome c-type biogenesis protein CcmH/NrfF